MEVLHSGIWWRTPGTKTLQFEEEFAAYHQVPHGVACTNGTAALKMALAALDIGPGDEVFVLVKGKAVLFAIDEQGMQIEEMKPGVIYNVCKGVWHKLTLTRDASWIIAENYNTHLHDSEFRQLSAEERNHLKSNLPIRVKQEA